MNSKCCVVIVILSVCALSLAAPQFEQQQSQQSDVQVVREKNNNDGSGNYLYTYELNNGQIVSEAGQLKTVGDQQVVVVTGQYSFVGSDGQTYWVNYTADENGFHPVVGTGPGGIGAGGDASIDPNALKSLIGK